MIHPASGLPITTPVRTIVDLDQAGIEPDHLGTLISDAIARGLLGADQLREAFAGREESLGVVWGD